MDFESAYKKYMEGTATPEEAAFVEKEIEMAKKVTDIIDSKLPEISETGSEDIKKVKKVFRVKTLAISAAVALICVVVAVGAILGSIFGVAISSAKKNQKYDETAAKAAVVAYVNANSAVYGTNAVVTESERDLDLIFKLKESHYNWEFEVKTDKGDYDFIVNTKNGAVISDD